ncbi:hypothetical protein K8R42_02310, partial [bacterium]|nr:hypothetical protein [bacterium]
MFKRINNWHLSVLVVIVSFLSIALIQQQVLADWTDPIGLPGETGGFRMVVNPMAEDLDMGNFSIFNNTEFVIDPDADGADKITVTDGNIKINNGQLCLEADCRSVWPAEGGGGAYWIESQNSLGNPNGIKYEAGGVGIGGRAHSSHILSVSSGGTSILKLDSGEVYA